MGFFKKLFDSGDIDSFSPNAISDEYYSLTAEEALSENGSKMILLEPRAYSEAQQIVDYLKSRNTVVVNLKRVTPEQAKRIIDFLSGAIYAISGEIQKIGGGIFLCTPNNVSVQGKITDDTEGKGIHDNDDINVEW
ncbi:MAG: cell division protein SepF [Mollicutes bacterium]|nr:cell division protein SepF [Mollicutes bacterium]